MTEFGIQVNIKVDQDLVNVRGVDGEAFESNARWVTEHPEVIADLTAAVRSARPITGQGLIERELGGVVIGEIVESPPWPPVGSGSWQPPPQQGYQAGPPVQQGFQSSLCGRCGKASACKTCNSPCNPVPRSVKNGEYYIHDCLAAPQGDRTHKGPWCNQA